MDGVVFSSPNYNKCDLTKSIKYHCQYLFFAFRDLTMEVITLEDHMFSSPCNITVAGPTGSGKTSLVLGMLKYRQELFSQGVAGVVYFYSEYQDVFTQIPGGETQLHQGLPTEEELVSYIEPFDKRHIIVVLDDLMSQVASSTLLADMFTKMSHHRNFSIINIAQNIYPPGKAARTQSLNSAFYLLTRTCRDLRQINEFGSQVFPGKSASFVKAYTDAVDNPLDISYPPHLLVSCHPLKTKRSCQLTSNILPPDGAIVLYKL